jgi:hypothetical protein
VPAFSPLPPNTKIFLSLPSPKRVRTRIKGNLRPEGKGEERGLQWRVNGRRRVNTS